MYKNKLQAISLLLSVSPKTIEKEFKINEKYSFRGLLSILGDFVLLWKFSSVLEVYNLISVINKVIILDHIQSNFIFFLQVELWESHIL